MILIIDNFDSFTYNLVQLLGELKQEVKVFRNDAITVEEAEKLHPDYLVVSPGPCTPDKAGVSIDMIRHFAGQIPVLGVCLGHQAVGAAFGGKIVKAKTLMHGKISDIMHDGKTLFSNLPPVITATRYHSLAVDASSLPDCLEVSAWTDDGEIMALRHRELAVEGLQFHPESVATATGREIIENFINRTKESTLTHLKQVLGKVTDGGDLSAEEMKHTMELVMEGKATSAQIGSFITALKMKGETPIEISSAAAVMREKATHITVPRGVTVVDTCGTGGDGAHTFNISTVAALIAAGAGVTVAKHGNRSVSSKCGSADVLVELGIDIGISPDRVSACLKEAGIAFLFAPSLHSAMKHVIGPRRELGVRTIFNILGPLANPAFADAQLLGVYDRKLVSLLAEVLKNLGTRRALVVHGSDGLDEITLTGKTWASELNGGKIGDFIIDPEDFGFSYCSPEELTGGAPDENAAIVLDILAGRETGPKRDIALLNAGAAIYIGGKGQDLGSAIGLARESVSSGAAMKKLEKLRQVTNG